MPDACKQCRLGFDAGSGINRINSDHCANVFKESAVLSEFLEDALNERAEDDHQDLTTCDALRGVLYQKEFQICDCWAPPKQFNSISELKKRGLHVF
ncbi:hypothetical protein CDAR_611391 [Caerostris darwini]|uniref:Uncharacterized protein n=1 Tax=Caerostris darwini TaxID=1538125 RepID=A0AAV4UQL4_9ARAC|nr:hypothetical protein CDAR_611391 [Caerostris darwini]